MSEADPRAHSCLSCGKDASGNFCQHCGAALGGRFCTGCGQALSEGSKFCNQCGTAVTPAGALAGSGVDGPRAVAPPSRGVPTAPTAPRPSEARTAATRGASGAATEPAPGSSLPWWIAGGAFFALIVVVGVSMVRSGTAGPELQPEPAAPVAGRAPDISQMTPREAADRLFNRIQQSMAQGDTAGALAFQPMGVQAYERAEPLDTDGVFHLALLQILRDPAAALSSAERILSEAPDHVLALGVAAQATDALGRPEDAAAFFRRLVDAFSSQRNLPLEEYETHPQLLDAYYTDAQAYLAGR